jgi:hypothetical protein
MRYWADALSARQTRRPAHREFSGSILSIESLSIERTRRETFAKLRLLARRGPVVGGQLRIALRSWSQDAWGLRQSR